MLPIHKNKCFYLTFKFFIFTLLFCHATYVSKVFAAEYWASPTGSGTTCSEGTPCAIEYAVETKAQSGDTVKAQSGTYTTGQLSIPAGVTLTADVQTAPPNCTVTLRPSSNLGVGTPFISIVSGTPGASGGQTLSYIELDGNGGSFYARQAIRVDNYSGVTLSYLYIHGFRGAATSSWETSSYGIVARSTEITESTAKANWPDYLQAPDQSKSASYPSNPLSGLEIHHCIIVDCDYDDGGTEDDAHPLHIFHLYNSSIHDCIIDAVDYVTEAVESAPGLLENVDIYNNYIRVHPNGVQRSGTNALWCWETWVHINCSWHNNTMINAGMSTTVGQGSEWYYNYIDMSGTGSGNRSQGIEATLTNNAKIHHNKVILSGSAYGENGTTFGCSNSNMPNGSTVRVYVYGNEVYNADGLNCLRHNAEDTNQTDYSWIISNTCVNSTGAGVRVDLATGTTIHMTARNNIFQGHVYGLRNADTVGTLDYTGSHNLLYGNSSADFSPSGDFTNETNDVTTQAAFIEVPASFTPASGSSPQVDAGTTTDTTVNGVVMTQKIHSTTNWAATNWAGYPIPSVVLTAPNGTPDIGAGEYGGSVTDETGPTFSNKSPIDGTIYSSGTTAINGDVDVTDVSGLLGCECGQGTWSYGAGTTMSNPAGDTYRCAISGLSDDTAYDATNPTQQWSFKCQDNSAANNESSGAWSFAVQSAESDIIIDNVDSACVITGTNSVSTYTSGYYGQNYAHNGADTVGTYATYDISSVLEYAGYYQVWENHTAYTNRPDVAPYVLTHTGGETTIYVNQQINGGQWNLLGSYYFSSQTGSIVIHGSDTGYTIYDAIKLVLVEQEPEPPAQQGVTRSMEVGAGVVNIKGGGNVNIQ